MSLICSKIQYRYHKQFEEKEEEPLQKFLCQIYVKGVSKVYQMYVKLHFDTNLIYQNNVK